MRFRQDRAAPAVVHLIVGDARRSPTPSRQRHVSISLEVERETNSPGGPNFRGAGQPQNEGIVVVLLEENAVETATLTGGAD